MSADEALPTDLPSMFEEIDRRIEALEAEIDQKAQAQEAASVKGEEERARAARAGELGPEWRTVQRRIDGGQTTLGDVFSGADESAAARALRELSRRNLASLREVWLKQDEDAEKKGSDADPSPAAKVSGAAAESHRHFEEAMQRVRDMLKDS
ncbi:MAG: hypothetical protein FWD18_09120 [Micrococcales bacterium]|nr:hypothetical protein [Micrococcales bacterium]